MLHTRQSKLNESLRVFAGKSHSTKLESVTVAARMAGSMCSRHATIQILFGLLCGISLFSWWNPQALAQETAASKETVASQASVPNLGHETPSDPRDIVAEIRVEGNRIFSREDVLRMVRTSVGRPYEQTIITEDVRRMISSKKFMDVQTTTQQTPEGRIVTFIVREKQILTSVKIIGSYEIRRNELLKLINLKRCDPADPYSVLQGKQLIEDHYREKGYGRVNVEIFEGDKPGDHRAIYVIHEGPKQRIFRVRFEGNAFASDGQLQTKIQSKAGIFWLFGGEVNRDKIDQDKRDLEGYYRSMGFFQAEIQQELEWDDKEKWLTLVFHIHEGPRSKIRSIEFAGNKRFEVTELLPERSITEGDYFNLDKLASDARKIQNVYGSQGYVKAKVRPDTKLFEEAGIVDITYVVQEDRQYRIGKMDPLILAADGESPHSRFTTVLDPIGVAPGDIANKVEMDASIRRINGENTFATEEEKAPKLTMGKATLNPSKPTNPYPGDFPNDETMVAERPDDIRRQSPNTPTVWPAVPVVHTPAAPNPSYVSAQLVTQPTAQTVPASTQTVRYQSPEATMVPMDDFGTIAEATSTSLPMAERSTQDQPIVRYQNAAAGTSTNANNTTSAVASGWGTASTFGSTSTTVRPGTQIAGSAVNYGSAAAGYARPSRTTTTATPLASTAQPTVSGYAYPHPTVATGTVATGAVAAPWSNGAPAGVSTASPISSVVYQSPTPAGSALAGVTAEIPGGVQQTQYSVPEGYGVNPTPTTPVTATGTVSGTPAYTNIETGGVGTYQGILPTNVVPPASESANDSSNRTNSYYSGGAGTPTTEIPVTGDTNRNPWIPSGTDEPNYYLPITPTVNEAATGKVMLGAAINSDNGLTGYFTVDEQNFDLLRFPRSWSDVVDGRAWRGAGQKFRLELMPGKDVQRYSVTVTNPYLPIFQRQLSGSVNGFYYDRYYSEWTEHRLGGRASLGYRFPTRPDLSMSLAFRGEQVKIDDIVSTPTPIPEYEEMRGKNNLYGFKFGFNHDVRDNSFLPTDGYYWSTGVEQVIGTFQYMRLDADVRKYFLLKEHPDQSNRHVLSLLGHAAWTGDDTPVYDKYFLGGTTTLRGFHYRGASVRESQYGEIVGGNFIMYGSAEYLFPITANDQFRGLLFCDVGTSQAKIDKWDEKFRVTPGFGFRITMPMLGPAPLALDFGFPVVKQDKDDKEVFSFSMGWFRY
ncbi:MAG: BamA/TamA family outer membrane protein [Thermoguttaceae bacterium]|nr:BamA/TamA family outer membrane protein [Thermoguttaceae bacterium]